MWWIAQSTIKFLADSDFFPNFNEVYALENLEKRPIHALGPLKWRAFDLGFRPFKDTSWNMSICYVGRQFRIRQFRGTSAVCFVFRFCKNCDSETAESEPAKCDSEFSWFCTCLHRSYLSVKTLCPKKSFLTFFCHLQLNPENVVNMLHTILKVIFMV